MATILAQSLSRHYGNTVAVSDLSFEIAGGTILGFLGPNGAGKSTTMRMLTGYLRPTSGTAKLNGYDIRTETQLAQRQIGYLPEGSPLYGEMTVESFLSFIASIRGYKGLAKHHAVARVLMRLDLESVAKQPIERLSKGFARRVGLAQAMIHEPSILILDEPTDGLDPIQKQQVRKLILELASDRIVIISTHILEEVSLLCQRLLVIAEGQIRLDDSPNGARARSRYAGAVTLTVDDPQTTASKLSSLREVKQVEFRGGQLTAFPSGQGDLSEAITSLIKQEGMGVQQFHYESGRLDDVFAEIVTKAHNV